MTNNTQDQKQWLTTNNLAIASIVGAGLYYLWIEHHSHLIYFLPYLIFLLCPFMHFFMHGSHSHSHGENHEDEQSESSATHDHDSKRLQEGKDQL